MPVLVAATCARIGAFECCVFFLFVVIYARSRVERFCDPPWYGLFVVVRFEHMTGKRKGQGVEGFQS